MTKIRGRMQPKKKFKTKSAPREKKGHSDRHGVSLSKIDGRSERHKQDAEAAKLLMSRARAWKRIDKLR